MTELKVGDRVTVKGWEDEEKEEKYWEGRTGTVYDADNQDAVCVEFDDQEGTNFRKGGFEAQYLVPAVKPFTFADIQVDDKIGRTLTRKNGSTHVSEGVVVSTDALSAADSEGYKLAYGSDGNPFKATVVLELLELLDRPKPKHWTETKPVGSVAVILDGIFTKTLKKTSEHVWNVLYAEDGYTYKDSNKAIERRVTGVDESKIHWIK